MPLVDPMAAFQMGQARGGVSSGVSSIGGAIRGILDDARKKGLLQAQSQFQTEGSRTLALEKEGREEERRGLPAETIFVGPTKDEDRTISHTRGQAVKTLPREDQTGALIRAMFAGEGEAPAQAPAADTGDSVTIQFNDGTSETMTRAAAQAAGYLK